eukprot:760947-Hanusia_phi.AAC.10
MNEKSRARLDFWKVSPRPDSGLSSLIHAITCQSFQTAASGGSFERITFICRQQAQGGAGRGGLLTSKGLMMTVSRTGFWDMPAVPIQRMIPRECRKSLMMFKFICPCRKA